VGAAWAAVCGLDMAISFVRCRNRGVLRFFLAELLYPTVRAVFSNQTRLAAHTPINCHLTCPYTNSKKLDRAR
jgi:hypothetical protein